MTRERFREVLQEYNISSLTSVNPQNITEQELRSLLKEMTEDKDVEQELINAVVVCVDLLGIDVKKAYPNLYKRCFSDNKGEKK